MPKMKGVDNIFLWWDIIVISIYVILIINDIKTFADGPILTNLRWELQVPDLDTSLKNCLKKASGVYTKWRYSYEENLCFLATGNPIIYALKTRIQILRPEWVWYQKLNSL